MYALCVTKCVFKAGPNSEIILRLLDMYVPGRLVFPTPPPQYSMACAHSQPHNSFPLLSTLIGPSQKDCHLSSAPSYLVGMLLHSASPFPQNAACIDLYWFSATIEHMRGVILFNI